MSKLSNKAKSSKLNTISVQNQELENNRLISNVKVHSAPKSYRLDPEVQNILKTILDRVNDLSNKKISESRLVRALILLGKDIDEKKILRALKEVW
jgi:hypothetical protein